MARDVRALSCPECGAPVELRGAGHALSVVCSRCLSVLDATHPGLEVLQRFESKTGRVRPRLPLGTRGLWKGAPHEVIGFQVRTIRVGGIDYSWGEYLLFNPWRGFRWLTEYDGHWNDVVVLKRLPEHLTIEGRPALRVDGETYRHFQSATAVTTFVLGEFPWRIRVGERAKAEDYVAPPRMISAEHTGDETTWSIGEYVPAREVEAAFSPKDRLRSPSGVFANQPSPYRGRASGAWKAFGALAAALLLLAFARLTMARQEAVFSGRFMYDHRADSAGAASAIVTEPFELRGRPSNVVVRTAADVSNSWLYVSYALIEERTGRALDFAREVSYYHGVDGGERWSEGSTSDRAVLPTVPSGRYYLRIEPEGPPARAPVFYSVRLQRDVPIVSHYLVAFLLLLAPPVIFAVQAASFETRRWAESDYAPDEEEE